MMTIRKSRATAYKLANTVTKTVIMSQSLPSREYVDTQRQPSGKGMITHAKEHTLHIMCSACVGKSKFQANAWIAANPAAKRAKTPIKPFNCSLVSDGIKRTVPTSSAGGALNRTSTGCITSTGFLNYRQASRFRIGTAVKTHRNQKIYVITVHRT